MSALVELKGDWVNLHAEVGLAAGTPLYIQNQGLGYVTLVQSTVEPELGASGIQLDKRFGFYSVANTDGEGSVWARAAPSRTIDTILHVEEFLG